MSTRFTVPGMSDKTGAATRALLQERTAALVDLALTLKHIHWNVVGPTFIGVHRMLDPQVEATLLMVDETAERIATLGGEPEGRLPKVAGARRQQELYPLGRAGVQAHLSALDVRYTQIVEDHRAAIDELEDLDLVSQDMLIGQSEKLEQFHWFVRAHLEDSSGELTHNGAKTGERVP